MGRRDELCTDDGHVIANMNELLSTFETEEEQVKVCMKKWLRILVI